MQMRSGKVLLGGDIVSLANSGVGIITVRAERLIFPDFRIGRYKKGGGKMVSKKLKMPDINIKVGQQTQIELKSNPSTGYEWYVVHKPDCLYMDSASYVAPQHIMPGAPGKQVFSFLGADACRDYVEFVYMRSWDFEIGKRLNYALNITEE